MPVWYWKTENKHAEISLVNNQYRLQVFSLWHGQQGYLVTGPLTFTGYANSLAEGKKLCIKHISK